MLPATPVTETPSNVDQSLRRGPQRGPTYRGLTALAPEAIAAGHQVVSIWRNVAVGLDVLLGREGVGHLPGPAVPHPAKAPHSYGAQTAHLF